MEREDVDQEDPDVEECKFSKLTYMLRFKPAVYRPRPLIGKGKNKIKIKTKKRIIGYGNAIRDKYGAYLYIPNI